MKKKIAASILCLSLVISPLSASYAVKDFAAHAGGSIHGIAYTNTLEALNNSYDKGFRTFEIDMMRTTDGHLILAHDYNWALPLLINKVGPLTYKQFKSSKAVYNLTLLDIHGLIDWMGEHPDALIILDKLDLEGYKYLSMTYPEYLDRFIPQAFKIEEVAKIKAMGYSKILLTLYQTNYTESQIIGFMSHPDLYGITISYESFLKYKEVKKNAGKTRLYVHTVNDIGHYFVVHNAGVYGIITDYLEPAGLMPNIYASRVSVSSSKAIEPMKIPENTAFDYAFFSVHEQYKRYNGYAFEVIEKVADGAIPKYRIMLANGEQMIALSYEIDGTYRNLEVIPR